VTDKKKSEVKEAVKALFSLMKSRKTAKNIMTRKVKYSNCEAVIGFYVSFMLLLICSV